jgi:hypothetical protein
MNGPFREALGFVAFMLSFVGLLTARTRVGGIIAILCALLSLLSLR